MMRLRLAGLLAGILIVPLAVVLTATSVPAVTDMPLPPVASKVDVWLESAADGLVVQPGDPIPWVVRVRTIGANRGLALIAVDLMQDPANPAPLDLVPAPSVPAGMEPFAAPAGFTNPGGGPNLSAYGGTPVAGPAGGMNLLQIGGAQNTFGVPGPCQGLDDAFCSGQQTLVTAGIGREPEGQVVATGVIPAPETGGVYRFGLGRVRASVLGEPAAPPQATRTRRVAPTVEQAWFTVEVAAPDGGVPLAEGDPGDPPFTGGMLAAGKAQDLDAVLRPADGAQLNRLHVRFWWPAVPGAGSYTLDIVEDDGSDDPFAAGTVMQHLVAGGEPRHVVTQGLAFGTSYAWRVPGATGVQRFTIRPLPAGLEPFLVVRPNTGDLQPGVTLVNLRGMGPQVPFSGPTAVALDENGAFVYFHQRNLGGPGNMGYVELRETGRLIMQRGRPAADGSGASIYEETLDGRITWVMPGDRNYLPHHDAQLMPDGDFLLLLQDDVFLPEDNFERRRGDRIVVLDRHSLEEMWEWRALGNYPLESGNTNLADWTHGNAALYNPADNCVYFSARAFSRISRIDFDTREIIYNMGMDWPAGDTDFGDGFFLAQHAPELQPDGNMVVFDNGNGRSPSQTRVVEIEFDDPASPTDAALVREFWLETEAGIPLFASFAGDADRQPNGNTVIMAGAARRILELGPEGDLLWSLILTQVGVQYQGYRAQRVATLVRDTPGDRDGDWDLDLADLAALQEAFGASGLGFPERLSDGDGNDVLDAGDVKALLDWMTGPLE